MDLCLTVAPKRETSVRTTRYPTLDQGTLLGPGSRVFAAPLGSFYFCTPPSRQSATWGEKSTGTRRTQGLRAEKGFYIAKPGGRASARAFGASLARTTASATLVPLRALCVGTSGWEGNVVVTEQVEGCFSLEAGEAGRSYIPMLVGNVSGGSGSRREAEPTPVRREGACCTLAVDSNLGPWSDPVLWLGDGRRVSCGVVCAPLHRASPSGLGQLSR